MTTEFRPFPKMARLSRECYITEKIDGTNASVFIGPLDSGDPNCLSEYYGEDGVLGMWAGSRTRWITPDNDNFGFAAWVMGNSTELFKLGVGRHFGEWWGSGIQRNYGFKNGERFFSLFNAGRWVGGDDPIGVASVSWDHKTQERTTKLQERAPACCKVVPILYRGPFDTDIADIELDRLDHRGSVAAAGFMRPEGVVVYHVAAGIGFKKTLDNDDQPKGKQV